MKCQILFSGKMRKIVKYFSMSTAENNNNIYVILKSYMI